MRTLLKFLIIALISGNTFFLNKVNGFVSEYRISIYFNGSKGTLITKGTTLKLKGSRLRELSFEGPVRVISTTEDYIEVELSEGKFTFQ